MHILTFLLCSVLRVCCLSAAPPGWSHFGLSWHGPVGHGRREHLRVNCSHNPSYVIRSTVPNTLKLAWRKLAGRSSSVAIFWSLRWRARCLPLDNRYNNYEMDLWNWEFTWRAANERILSSNISCCRVCEPLTVDLMVRDRVSRALCSISKSCSGALKRQWVTVGATTENLPESYHTPAKSGRIRLNQNNLKCLHDQKAPKCDVIRNNCTPQ